MSTTRNAYGPLVRVVREALGVTLPELADRIQVSRGYLSRLERGKHRPSVGMTGRIAAALQVDPDCLTGQKPPYRVVREALGKRVDEFAATLGVAVFTLDRIEDGLVPAPPELHDLIARRLGVHPDALRPPGRVAA